MKIDNSGSLTEGKFGSPVDALDLVCKQHRECLNCAHRTYGDQCEPKLVTYQVQGARTTCTDPVNTCERAVCECDLQFAMNHNVHKVCILFIY